MKPTGPQSFWRAGQQSKTSRNTPNPPSRPQARGDAQHLGAWGVAPAGDQRAAPSGARRIGAGAGRSPAAVRGGRHPGEGQARLDSWMPAPYNERNWT